MLKIEPTTEATRANLTKITCPNCGRKLPEVAVLKDSKIEGLTFKCKKCRKLFAVTTE